MNGNVYERKKQMSEFSKAEGQNKILKENM